MIIRFTFFLQFKFKIFHTFSYFVHQLRLSCELTSWPAPSWLDSSVGRELGKTQASKYRLTLSGSVLRELVLTMILRSWCLFFQKINWIHFLFAFLPVLLVLVCIKRNLWKRVISSRFYDRREKEGLFEQEERINRKEKHEQNQRTKAQKFAEKYELNDPSKAYLCSP